MNAASQSITLTSEMLNLISEIDTFKGRWSATQALAPDRLAALQQVATIESVGSSTRIEGVQLTNSQIEALLRGIKTYSFRSRDEQEVAGYAEVMETMFEAYRNIALTENHIKQLHSQLLRHSTKDERHRGEYKKFPNHVEAFDSQGKSAGLIFKTASPFDTKRLMQELVEWTSTQLEKKDLHALLVIAIFVVVFLQIHPFQDGNGRLSRVLTTLLLLRQGYDYAPYSSLERVVEENKKAYYLALRKAQADLDQPASKKNRSTHGINEWILFFLRSMQKQKQTLENKLEAELAAYRLPPLSLQIIEALRSRGPSALADLVAITQANRNTVKVHVKRLASDGLIQAQGTGRGVRYHLATGRS